MRLVWFLLASMVVAASASERLAVVEVEAAPEVASAQAAALLTDALRAAAVTSLGQRLQVLTRETIVEQLPEAALRCGRTECMATLGAKLQAAFVLGGALRRMPSELALAIEAYDTRSKQLVGSRVVRGASVNDLAALIERDGVAMIWEWMEPRLRTAGEGRIGGESPDFVLVAARDAVVTFESTPPGASVQLNGQPLCAQTPCSRRVALGSHAVAMALDGFAPWSAPQEIKAATAVRATLLSAHGLLDVETDPPGATVHLDGRELGRAPIKGWWATPGKHVVRVTHGCFVEESRAIEVAVDASSRMLIALTPRMTTYEVRAQAGIDAVNGSALVDGHQAGVVPGTFSVPTCATQLKLEPTLSRYRAVEVPLTGAGGELVLRLDDGLASRERSSRESERAAFERKLGRRSGIAPAISLRLWPDAEKSVRLPFGWAPAASLSATFRQAVLGNWIVGLPLSRPTMATDGTFSVDLLSLAYEHWVQPGVAVSVRGYVNAINPDVWGLPLWPFSIGGELFGFAGAFTDPVDSGTNPWLALAGGTVVTQMGSLAKAMRPLYTDSNPLAFFGGPVLIAGALFVWAPILLTALGAIPIADVESWPEGRIGPGLELNLKLGPADKLRSMFSVGFYSDRLRGTGISLGFEP